MHTQDQPVWILTPVHTRGYRTTHRRLPGLGLQSKFSGSAPLCPSRVLTPGSLREAWMTGEKRLSPLTQGEAEPQDHPCRGQRGWEGDARRLPPSPRPCRADPPDTAPSPAHPAASAERRCHDGFSICRLPPAPVSKHSGRGNRPQGRGLEGGEGRALDAGHPSAGQSLATSGRGLGSPFARRLCPRSPTNVG